MKEAYSVVVGRSCARRILRTALPCKPPTSIPACFPPPVRPTHLFLTKPHIVDNLPRPHVYAVNKGPLPGEHGTKGAQAHVETDKIPIMRGTRIEAAEPSEAAGWSTVDLVEQARNGDRTAFHRLVDRFQPEIYRMIFYRTRSRMDAEDLTQDVMLKAYRNIRRLKSPEVFRSWLYRIAVNRIKDYYRGKQFRSLFGFVSLDEEGFHETAEAAEAPVAEDAMAQKEFWRQFGRMLTGLSAMEKEVFLLRFFDQLTLKEISATLHRRESTIKTHLYRALRKLKAMAGELGGLLEGS